MSNRRFISRASHFGLRIAGSNCYSGVTRTGLCRSLAILAIGAICVAAARAEDPGQSALPAAVEGAGTLRPAQRAELRRQLEQHATVLDAQSAVLKIAAKLVGPSVVHIQTDLPTDRDSQPNRGHGIEEHGSGAITEIGGNYFVITARHVVRDAAPPAVHIDLADGRRIHPQKILEDPDTDVAVLPISAPDLVAATIGDSDRLDVGDFVLAIGSPFGLRHSVTFGIISARGRRDLRPLGGSAIRFQDFLQTDAAINPGNSGGPLINLRGEIVGLNDCIVSGSGRNEGIGFAITSNMLMSVARQLIQNGKVTRGFLGVNLESKYGPAMAAELGLPRPVGALVTSVTANSPAAAAGLQSGDVIIEFNHTRVEDDAHLVNVVSLTEVGHKATLLVFRDRKLVTLSVELGDRSKFGQ
ncbi:MAG: trypsin-like peptidase domain-containing protein [Planctomycetaceae bacterium]|nr:trypsin-like peptidase domain-containing protein [Planctomycetaceae bacterium]